MHIEKLDFFALRDFADPDGKNKNIGNGEDISVDTDKEDNPEPITEDNIIEVVEPSYSQEELNIACEKARIEGYNKGRQDAEAEIDKAEMELNQTILSLVNNFLGQYAQLENKYLEIIDKQQHDVTKLAVYIAKMVAGEALKEQPEHMVENMVRECLPNLINEPHLLLTVNPKIKDKMENIIKEQIALSGYKGNITIEDDENLAVTDAKLSWNNGFAEQNLDKLWQNIQARL